MLGTHGCGKRGVGIYLPMQRSTLHEFDLRLCDDVCSNVARPFGFHPYSPGSGAVGNSGGGGVADTGAGAGKVRAKGARTDPFRQYTDLPMPHGYALWLKRNLSPGLWRYISSNKSSDYLLTDEELEEMALALDDMPTLLPHTRWDSCPVLYARYFGCLPEIRRHFSGPTAERFARLSVRFAERLERQGLRLPEGIRVVAKWIMEIRGLLTAMERIELLPRPVGRHPTPDLSEEELGEDIIALVERIRAFFGKTPGLNKQSKTAVFLAGTDQDLCVNWITAAGTLRVSP